METPGSTQFHVAGEISASGRALTILPTGDHFSYYDKQTALPKWDSVCQFLLSLWRIKALIISFWQNSSIFQVLLSNSLQVIGCFNYIQPLVTVHLKNMTTLNTDVLSLSVFPGCMYTFLSNFNSDQKLVSSSFKLESSFLFQKTNPNNQQEN